MTKFSIVTICWNDADALLKTLRSSVSQTHPDIEVIVQDGASTDHTADVVDGFGDWVTHYESKPDNGIYQAMNNALKHCHGDFTVFLNAADVFFNNSVLSEVSARISLNDDIVYGRAVSLETGRIHNYRPPDQYWAGMIMDHQATFVRTELLQELGFDESLRICGDYDLLSRARIAGKNFKDIEMEIVSKPFSYGMSASFVSRAKERVGVADKHFGQDHDVQDLIKREIAFHINSRFGDILDREIVKSMTLDEVTECYEQLDSVSY